MTKEIIEIPLFQGINLEQIRNGLAAFPGCFVDTSKSEQRLFIECQAEHGHAVRVQLEAIRDAVAMRPA